MMPIDPKPGAPVTGRKVIVAEHQGGVRPLPGWALDDEAKTLVTRWHLTEEERRAVAEGADVWLTIATFGRPVQPVAMAVRPADLLDGWPT